MPFQSKAQRRKFYALKARGEMDQKTIDEWEEETPDNIPERKKNAMVRAQLYAAGARHAFAKLGLDASDFQEFAQSDDAPDTLEMTNQAREDMEAPDGPNSTARLLKQTSPWSGSTQIVQPTTTGLGF